MLTTTVKAETSADLYNFYGVQDTTAFTEYKNSYLESKKIYDAAVEEYNYVTEFNAVIDSLNVEELKKTRKAKKKELNEISEKINTEGFFLQYDELQALYSEYNTCEAEYAYLSKKYSKYKGKEKLPIPEYDLDIMAQHLAELEINYQNLKKDSTLGDVSNLTNFMENTICVKREFDGTMTMFRAVQDTGVLALFDGYVLVSQNTPDYGEVITISCSDNIEVSYYGVRARYVQEGDVVKQYQKIATTNDGVYISLKIGDQFYDVAELYKSQLEPEEQEE